MGGRGRGAPFVGREQELERLERALDRVARGGGAVALIRGEPGVGKSSLAAAFADRVSERSTMLWGACLDEGAAPAFGPWRLALESADARAHVHSATAALRSRFRGARAAAAAACRYPKATEGTMTTTTKRTYVLVAGSWHGAWCWYKVLPRLEALGHSAIAINLPGHGTSWTNAKDVTLQSYVEAVTTVLDRQPGPVVLVGHSRGGIVISQVAEERCEKIDHLVYVSAFLIPDGESMLQTATTDAESLIVANLVFDEAGGTHMLKREAFREALYADCGEEDVTLASTLLTPEPNAPVGTPLCLGARFERVPRVYIECRRDRGISPAVQKKMQARVGVTKSLALDTSHSPFLSAPAELVRLLAAG